MRQRVKGAPRTDFEDPKVVYILDKDSVYDSKYSKARNLTNLILANANFDIRVEVLLRALVNGV